MTSNQKKNLKQKTQQKKKKKPFSSGKVCLRPSRLPTGNEEPLSKFLYFNDYQTDLAKKITLA